MKWAYCSLPELRDEQFEAVYRNLAPSRKIHVDRKKKAADKKRTLAGEWLIKSLLTQEFGIEAPQIERAENGRPFLANADICISIGHCEDMVVAAADFESIGIDVERIGPFHHGLPDKVCVPEEKAYILSHEASMQVRFFEIWTGKEAYFKKQGTGITDLKSVNVLLLHRQVFRIGDYIIQII